MKTTCQLEKEGLQAPSPEQQSLQINIHAVAFWVTLAAWGIVGMIALFLWASG